jgi:hypothetical protein
MREVKEQGDSFDSEVLRTEDMEKPLVSVIIIFLNEERFIREAIESVFSTNL